jgi:hypothetical protein
MSFKTWAPILGCVAAFGLFAGSASAQTDAAKKLAALQGKLQQQTTQVTGDNPQATTTCAYTFTSGSGFDYLQYCVTVNGNIVEFQSPQGIESMQASPTTGEGYGVCDMTNNNTAYYDWAGSDSGNWGAPTLVKQTATEVVIARTTSDGLWTLTQTITQNAGQQPFARVQMQIKNNSNTSKQVLLMRWAAVGALNGFSNNQDDLDSTTNSVWGSFPANLGFETPTGGGLMLQNLGAAPDVEFYQGFPLNTYLGPNPCAPVVNWKGPLTGTDGSILMVYAIQNIVKAKPLTFAMKYVAF